MAEQLTGQQEIVFVNDAMRWGTEHEDEAVSLWEAAKKKKAEKIGFCISDEFPFLGLSPDRLIASRGKYTKAIEVKAPTSKTVIKYILDGVIPKDYEWQVVNYFLVCEYLKELDFVIYDPRLIDDRLKLTIINVKRSDVQESIDQARERLIAFRQLWSDVYHKIKNK